MNHIYRSIWSQALGAWVAVSENTKSKSKQSNTRGRLLATGLVLCSSSSWALPTGDQLVVGLANISTPNAGQMQIDQTSQQAIINWQGFSIAPNESVNIQQPNINAALLNRVIGQDASQIQGQLHANGQVYLVNPNGVLFGNTAQVDVGGLFASTHNITNADFLTGILHFTQDNATGTVSNQGSIKTPDGGIVALIGNQVSNDGTITTPKGTSALAAGKTVDLDFTGDGLLEVKVSEAALNAQISNKGAIQADGGRVVLTAKAAGQLIDTVINQQGIIKAQGLVEHNGEIILDGGDNGTVNVSGTLDTNNTNQGLNSSNGSSNLGLNANTTGGNIKVTGQQIAIQNGAIVTASGTTNGGIINIGDKQSTSQTSIADGANITTQALDHGTAGTINIFASMNNGAVNVAGQLNASAPNNGDGGFIETSAAHVKVNDSAKISTKATNGKTGTWLIDPFDFTIAASGGDMTGAFLSNILLGTSVNIDSINGTVGGVNGDVNVNDTINWSANLLTLSANRNININANLNGSGTAQLALHYGRASQFGGATDNYFINNGAKVSLPAGNNFSTIKGWGGATIGYTVITSLGSLGSITGTDLQGINGNLAGNYVLGADIDASATSTVAWNYSPGFTGFRPLGIFTGTRFTGRFHGLGHTISSLTINESGNDVGLFGAVSGGTIRDVGLINANVTLIGPSIKSVGALVGYIDTTGASVSNSYAIGGSVRGNSNIGGLVGFAAAGTIISNDYATDSVTGSSKVGGLVGINNGGNISNAYATGSINGSDSIGGLVGLNGAGGSINNAYATGSVQGNTNVGGLVGFNSANINNAYAIGRVTGGSGYVGGLSGNNNGSISNTYATGAVTGAIARVGALVGLNNGLISNSFWDTQITGLSNGVAGGSSAGTTGKTTAQMQQLATFTGWNIANTGGSSAVWRIYEFRTAPLLRSLLTPLTITADNISKTYNGLADSVLSNPIYSIGVVNNANLLGTAYGTAKNTGSYNAAEFYSNQQGYDITVVNGLLTINPATLTYTANPSSRVYGDANPLFSGTVTGFVNGETLATVTTGTLSFDSLANNLSNVGSYAVNGSGLLANNSNYLFSQAASNAIALSITPATLTYTADIAFVQLINGVFPNPPPTFTGTVTGFVNNETQATATTGLLNFSNTIGSTIDGSGLSANNGNYLFTQAASNSSALNLFMIQLGDPAIPPELAPVSDTASTSTPVLTPTPTPTSTSTPVSVLIANNVASLVTTTAKSDNSTISRSFSAGSESVSVSKSIPESTVSVSDVSDSFASDAPSSFASDLLSSFTSDAPSSKSSSADSASSKSASADSSSKKSSSSESNSNNSLTGVVSDDSKPTIIPTLQVKNSAGQVKQIQMSANKQFLSLLLEDGSVRVWDFQTGVQRKIVAENKDQTLTDISAVDDNGERLSIASKAGIGVHDIISLVIDDKLTVNADDIKHFVSSKEGSLLLVNAGASDLSLWNNKKNKQLWQLNHERGVIYKLALSDDQHYGAVLSRQAGVYAMDKTNKLQPLTDAVNIIDLSTGKTVKALPNIGEEVLYMQFKDNDTLQLGLASGKLLDWSIATASKKTTSGFAETVVAIDNNKDTYAYVTKNGTVRVGNGQDHLQLSIQNKENPIKDAKLIEDGKKLLTVLANGDLALWDVETGKKLLRLFSTQQGWTVMDAFGRFDGSDDSIENFTWLANEEDIPLNSFSENYYEPGLLTSVLKNQDFLNSDSSRIQEGISLPPKVALQLAEQQSQGDKVAVQLDVYDRGGGIDKVNIYHNGKLLNNDSQNTAPQSLQENTAEHRVLSLNIVPSAGKNTLKVVASNTMGIENSSSEISFDGKTKAYAASVRLLTVGINNYKESQLHLNYSVPDAELISEAIKNGAKLADSKTLINENATKPKILAELKELSQGSEQDSLIIYFAGHGVAVDKEWYFLPYETKLEPNLKKIVAAGISASELSEIFKNSKIQHILLMIDSCHSGGSMESFSTLQNGQRYFTRQLSRSLGITIITAAAKDQEAAEMKSLGHGLFTYLISQELQKKDNSQPLTAHSIAENILKTLPAFSKKTIGVSQEPVVYTKGSDFMLTNLFNDKK